MHFVFKGSELGFVWNQQAGIVTILKTDTLVNKLPALQTITEAAIKLQRSKRSWHRVWMSVSSLPFRAQRWLCKRVRDDYEWAGLFTRIVTFHHAELEDVEIFRGVGCCGRWCNRVVSTSSEPQVTCTSCQTWTFWCVNRAAKVWALAFYVALYLSLSSVI